MRVGIDLDTVCAGYVSAVRHVEEITDFWGGKHPSVRAYQPELCGLTAGQRSPLIRKPHVLASC